jgi:hypothetical protein
VSSVGMVRRLDQGSLTRDDRSIRAESFKCFDYRSLAVPDADITLLFAPRKSIRFR